MRTPTTSRTYSTAEVGIVLGWLPDRTRCDVSARVLKMATLAGLDVPRPGTGRAIEWDRTSVLYLALMRALKPNHGRGGDTNNGKFQRFAPAVATIVAACRDRRPDCALVIGPSCDAIVFDKRADELAYVRAVDEVFTFVPLGPIFAKIDELD